MRPGKCRPMRNGELAKLESSREISAGQRLRGKVAMITGAGSGLGRATAELFAEHGAGVIVADIDRGAADATVALLRRLGRSAVAVTGDAGRETDVARMVDEGVHAMGSLHVLDANLGVLWRQRDGSVLEMDEGSWDGVMDATLKSGVWLAKFGVPHLRAAGGGSIVLVGSVSGLIGVPNPFDAYVAAKGALRVLTRSLAIQLAPDNIRANIIHPGTMDTPLQAEFLTRTVLETVKADIPLGRIADPREIAYAALFLASEESSYMTGAEMILDGGYTAQ